MRTNCVILCATILTSSLLVLIPGAVAFQAPLPPVPQDPQASLLGCTPHSFTATSGRIIVKGVGYDVSGTWTDGCGGSGQDDSVEGTIWDAPPNGDEAAKKIGTFSSVDTADSCTATVNGNTTTWGESDVDPSSGRVDWDCGTGDDAISGWMEN